MLAYAANRPRAAQRRSSPNTMLGIIAAHVAAVALVMSAKMDLPPRIVPTPTLINFIKQPPPPDPAPVEPRIKQAPAESTLDRPQPQLSLPNSSQMADATSNLPNLGGVIGSSTLPSQHLDPVPLPTPVKLDAKLLTPASELKPPYPESKLASGEEALLRLRLTIDERGRVIAVEPIGKADRLFLEAARRHLMAHWRYRAATEDGRPVTSSAVITLRFQLDG